MKDLGTMTGELGHSKVSDIRAAADRSAYSRSLCAGSQASVGMPAGVLAFGWVALPDILEQ